MNFLNFIQSEHALALLITVLIFLTTILLLIKRWVSFSMTSLLLLFALVAGLLINYHQDLPYYLTFSSPPLKEESTSQGDFHQQILDAIENLKIEISTEKENLRHVKSQLQEIMDSLDIQKQKLQNFIEEMRQNFQTDRLVPSSHALKSDSPSEQLNATDIPK